ncbi:MAG: hypothetical protein WC455_27610 [Dehalococcoidia bacterium]|jgi:hypothetical protein
MKNRAVFDLQLMASDEIMQYIPPSTIQEIKAKDAHPLYRAYIIGEEGEAVPVVVGYGGRVLNWLRSSISAMVTRLQYGTKIFFNHAETNEAQGRTAIGELVGKALEYMNGKMRAIAVTYIYPEHRDLPADAASIEAEIELDPTGKSNVVDAVHVRDISGIAVFDKSKHKPAFPAAGLIAQLQAWDSSQIQGGDNMPELSVESIKAFLKNGAVAPSAVFDKPTLLSDQLVGDHVLAKLNQEYARRMKAEDELEAVKKEMPEKITKLETENKTLRQTIITGRAREMAAGIFTERKLPDTKAKFVTMKLPDFKVEGDVVDDATIKTQLNSFIDKKLDECATYEKVFTPEQPAGKTTENPAQTTGGDPNAGLGIDNV